MAWLHRFLSQFGFYRRIVNKTRKIYIPGLKGTTVYILAADFFGEIGKEGIATKASALAYRFMLALFPTIIFIFTLIPFIPIRNFQTSLLSTFEQLLPDNVFSAAESTLREIVNKPNTGLLSAGFVASLFLSTNGVSTLIKYLNKSTLLLKKRSYLGRRLRAMLLTILLVFLLIGSVFAGIAGHYVIAYLTGKHFIKSLLGKLTLVLLQWIIVTGLFYFAIAILYYYGPSRKARTAFFTIGGATAAFLCIITTVGFAQYVQHFGTYNKIYGSLGTLIVIMILLYINSAILLVGYDLDISIQRCNHFRSHFQNTNSVKEKRKNKLK